MQFNHFLPSAAQHINNNENHNENVNEYELELNWKCHGN